MGLGDVSCWIAVGFGGVSCSYIAFVEVALYRLGLIGLVASVHPCQKTAAFSRVFGQRAVLGICRGGLGYIFAGDFWWFWAGETG